MSRLHGSSGQGARQRGYVLIMVLAALALIAYIAADFAQRIDRLRGQSLALDDYVRGRSAVASAKSLALYRLASLHGGPDAYGPASAQIKIDGRPYVLPDGTRIAVQDARATLSLNAISRDVLDRLLEPFGINPARRGAMADVLFDYTDTDSLRRLNGAEEAEYRALGVVPPRNDWLMDLRELHHMPLWRDEDRLQAALPGLVNTWRTGLINPNIVPLQVLRAVLPNAREEQLALFDTLRRAAPFSSGAAAQSATGLALNADAFVFYASDEQTLWVVAPAYPRAFQFSIRLTPGDRNAPWQISDFHLTAVPPAFNAEASAAFPLPVEGLGP